jgi:hypothetical protein
MSVERIDLRDKFDVFVITNGRESFEYVIKSIKNQIGVEFDLNVIRDQTWIDACNQCLYYSNKPYYFRIDDDMILHPMTFLFYNETVIRKYQPNAVLYYYRLWEPWNNKPVTNMKIYNRKLTKVVGFETDENGRVDALFKKKSFNRGYRFVREPHNKKQSVVGIHAACRFEDNFKYSQLRNELETERFKRRKEEIKFLDQVYKDCPLEKQLDMADKDVYQYNKQRKTNFFGFLNRSSEYYNL